jgi:hypothetical protein
MKHKTEITLRHIITDESTFSVFVPAVSSCGK